MVFMRIGFSATLVSSILLHSLVLGKHPHPLANSKNAQPPYIHQNNLPPRREWNENFGYCGEIGFVCAGLYFGQYCSLFTMRSLTSPGIPQYENTSQLLLGVNEDKAAEAVRLAYDIWDPIDVPIEDFLVWVKKHTTQGHPVLIGLFNNEYLLYGKHHPTGDSEYDHIVVVTALGSYTTPINDGMYHGTDTLYFSDSGLYGDSKNSPFFFNGTFAGIQKTRDEANDPSGPVYSLSNDQPNHYGIAFLGIQDNDLVTLPISILASPNWEFPEIVDGANENPPPSGSNTPPAASPVTLTITVSQLTPGAQYNLYLYDDFSKVPTKNFNALASQAKEKFVISSQGTTYITRKNAMSNQQVIFRAVPISAP